MFSRGIRSALVTAGLAALVAGGLVAPAESAPRTVQGAAYEVMKKFMDSSSKNGFSQVSAVGDKTVYQQALSNVNVAVDPSITAVAVYDPATNTIKFSKDPRSIPKDEALNAGETVWHEVTHAIEDQHGDIGVGQSAQYAERNTAYMTQLATLGRAALEKLEKDARNGASVATLKADWKAFNKAYLQAFRIEGPKDYPPDATLQRDWFGFRMDPTTIKKFYLSGKFLSGKAGKNLRAALSATPDPTPPTTGNSGPGGVNSDPTIIDAHFKDVTVTAPASITNLKVGTYVYINLPAIDTTRNLWSCGNALSHKVFAGCSYKMPAQAPDTVVQANILLENTGTETVTFTAADGFYGGTPVATTTVTLDVNKKR